MNKKYYFTMGGRSYDCQSELVVAGHYIREGWFEPLSWDLLNKGNHIIHTGGKYDSYLQVPIIPPKYVAGDYVYR